MSRRTHALGALIVSTLVVAGAAAGYAGVAHADSTAAPTAQDLFVSEIHPDNGVAADGATTGPTNVDDNYEFFEVTNTTGADINLGADGIGISYSTSPTPATALKFAVSNGIAGDAVTPGPLEVTIPAHGSTVFWLEYTSSATLNTYAKTEADFRAFYNNTVPAGTQIVRVEGQGGIANGGSRTLALVADGQVLSSSFLPTRSPTTPGVSTHLQVPAAGSTAATYLSDGDPTPGTVTADQLVAASPTPPPAPTSTPSLPPYVHPKPVIVGDPAVGNTLSVDPGQWIPYDTSLGFQWYADETPIPGATGISLKLSGKLNGSLITVTVTGWYDGYSATETSDPTAPVGSSKGNH